MAASIALLGYEKALSDDLIRELVEGYATAYAEQVLHFATHEDDEDFRLTLEGAEGVLLDALSQARRNTRIGMLEAQTAIEDGDRVFSDGHGVRRLEDDERATVLEAYRGYLETIPEVKRQHSVSYEVKDVVGRTGFGIGSAGLPAYSLLVEGRSQALENDVILSMKQANVPAPSRVVTDEEIRGAFEHQGHRTAVSQRALQARADPWLGWCALDGVGQVVTEVSPYEEDLDWDMVTEPDELAPLLRALGRATAKVHCVSDSHAEQELVDFQVEEAIAARLDGHVEAFASAVADFGASYGEVARDDHRLFVDAFRNGEIPGVDSL
jgi:uncharacterized protein (DUF2252 family)